jgi:hypothetical protein
VKAALISRWKRGILETQGYTLAETLVALSLFVGVLIPLLSAIGSLLYDDRAERLQEALHIAQLELAQSEVSRTQSDNVNIRHGLKLERRMSTEGHFVKIDVCVYDMRKKNARILYMSKTVPAP